MFELNALKQALIGYFEHLDVFVFDEIDSTSACLKNIFKQKRSDFAVSAFCCTQKQTAGYGQRGRSWLSNDRSMMFSLGLQCDYPVTQLSLLPLYLSFHLQKSLFDFYGVKAQIKWPNDLYLADSKLSGLIVEVVASKVDSCSIVIGIGVNGGPEQFVDSVTGFEATSAFIDFARFDTSTHALFFKQLISCILEAKDSSVLSQFAKSIESGLLKNLDYFQTDESVIVYDNAAKKEGLYVGMTSGGMCEVRHASGIDCYHSAMVSIRKNKA